MTSVYPNGIPDLLAIKDGRAQFIETKRPGGKLSEIQKVIHEQLSTRGFPVYIVSNKTDMLGCRKEQAQLTNSTVMAKKKKATKKSTAKKPSKKRAVKKQVQAPSAPDTQLDGSAE